MHKNNLALLGLIMVASVAIWQYAQDQSKIRTFERLYAQTKETDLPLHRIRSSVNTTDSSDIYDKIRLNLQKEDFMASLADLHLLIQKEPANVTVHFYAGGVAERIGDSETAEIHYQIVRMNSERFYEAALKKLSLIYYQSNQISKCKAMLRDLAMIGGESNNRWNAQMQQLLH